MPWEFTCRPLLRGREGMVTAGHYLAAAAGFAILNDGGNAVDAAVAAGFAESLVEPHQNGLGGEAPMIIWPAEADAPVVLSGQGPAPAAASLERFRSLGVASIPGDGLLPACVPAVVSTYITALAEFGTRTLAEVTAPALRFAREGFAVSVGLAEALDAISGRFLREWPVSAGTFLKVGRAPAAGDALQNTAWADTVEAMLRAESEAGGDRLRGLDRAHDAFYRGEVADRIMAALDGLTSRDIFGGCHASLLSAEDLAGFHAQAEAPVSYRYGDATIYKCASWSQGPVFLQQLALLNGYDLCALGHNSADYLHLLIECAKLAFADRERFYGDPAFTDVPMETLLSDDYNDRQRAFIDMGAAIRVPLWDSTPAPIPPAETEEAIQPFSVAGPRTRTAVSSDSDTTHVDAADASGLMVSLTPSGGWITSSPVLRGLGFPLGTRAQMFRLVTGHPNAAAPGKRPRTTLTPSMAALPKGRRLAFGTPGSDGQDQWTLQFFLNHHIFGMDLQTALEAPTAHTRHFPSSFYPHDAAPGSLMAEARIPKEVRAELGRRGHDVTVLPPWENGRALAILFDPSARFLTAGVSPRHETAYAMGW